MAEEMRLHLELQTERNIAAGMSAEDAHHAALRQFGGVEQIKEVARAQRSFGWLEDGVKDIRFAARMLRKTPSFTIVAVVSLAIGIGLNTAVFSIINAIFYQTIRGVPQPERVLFFNGPRLSWSQLEALREQLAPVAQVLGAAGFEATVAVGNAERTARVGVVSANHFSTFGVRTAQGRLFAAESACALTGGSVAVLNHAFWREALGADPGVLGQSLRVDGTLVTVIGVAARDFHGPGPEGPALWVPVGALADAGPTQFAAFGRLKPGVSLAQAQAAVDLIVTRSPEVFGADLSFRLSLGREDWRGEMSAAKKAEFFLVTTVPLVIAAGLLWIACSNVGNLLLARAVQRRKEIAIRLASGATRGRLLRMLMAESLLLAAWGGAAGLWFGAVTLDFVFATLADFGAFSVQLDARVFAYTGAVSVVAALLFGLVPAHQAVRPDVNATLKGESGSPAFRSSRLRGFFLITQITSSFALLAVAGTFVKSLVGEAYVGAQAQRMDRLAYAPWPHAADEATATAQREEARSRVLGIDGVADAAWVEGLGAEKRRFGRRKSTGADTADVRPEVWLRRVDEHYFAVVGATVLRGSSAFGRVAEGAVRQVVVNRAMAKRFWSRPDAVGEHFEVENRSYLVAGIVEDGGSEPTVYDGLPLRATNERGLLIATKGSAEDATVAINDVLRNVAAETITPRALPLREIAFRTMTQLTQLAVFVGGLALALAASGIYASMAFSTSQRTQEIGVRMALGATRAAVLRLVLAGGLKTVAWGGALGAAAAVTGVRLLFGLLTGAPSQVDVVAFASVAIVFAVVGIGACGWPAIRAARVDPMVALRYE